MNNLIDRYRISNGSVFEWDSGHDSYVHIGKTTQYTKEQLKLMKFEKCDENDHEIEWDENEEEEF